MPQAEAHAADTQRWIGFSKSGAIPGPFVAAHVERAVHDRAGWHRGANAGIPAATVLDVLSGLVDKSLVLAEPSAHGVRYRFLETIRQYAAERMEVLLPEADAIRRRHRTWHVEFANKALLDYSSSSMRRPTSATPCTSRFLWGFRGSWQEGRDWIERVLALPDAAHPVSARADALTALGQMAFQQGDTRRLSRSCPNPAARW